MFSTHRACVTTQYSHCSSIPVLSETAGLKCPPLLLISAQTLALFSTRIMILLASLLHMFSELPIRGSDTSVGKGHITLGRGRRLLSVILVLMHC